jgi:hypothetical protein
VDGKTVTEMNRGVKELQMQLSFRQSGQSTFEYLCVVSFCVIILVVPDSSGKILIVQLANAFKGFYNAFAFAISFSSTLMPL